MTVRFAVTVRQVREDGTEAPVEGELAAALAGPAEQFAGLAAWAADEVEYSHFRGHFHYAAFGAQLSNWRS